MITAEEIIEKLELVSHPEGGYYKETYRSEGSMSLSGYDGQRSYGTAIFFMLTRGSFSTFHKIRQDEMWHFYKGSTLELHIITKEGDYKMILIGNDLNEGEIPQYVVKGGDYFAARVHLKGDYSLLGCTVSPGFDFRDFDMPDQKSLTAMYPEHKLIIEELTR